MAKGVLRNVHWLTIREVGDQWAPKLRLQADTQVVNP